VSGTLRQDKLVVITSDEEEAAPLSLMDYLPHDGGRPPRAWLEEKVQQSDSTAMTSSKSTSFQVHWEDAELISKRVELARGQAEHHVREDHAQPTSKQTELARRQVELEQQRVIIERDRFENDEH